MKKEKITRSLCITLLLLPALYCHAQVKHPVKWTFNSTWIEKDEAVITGTADMQDGWHIYSQLMEGEDDPMPTRFTFLPSFDYELIGKVDEESARVEQFDSTFLMQVIWFNKIAVFTQRIKVKVPGSIIKGKVEFMACRNVQCLPPEEVQFSIDFK